MTRPINPSKYRTERIGYPIHLDKKCPLCNSQVQFKYANSGKLVHCLDEDIHQIVNFYQCTDSECSLSSICFNPSSRFDYSSRTFGKDVFLYIFDEFIKYRQKPNQIQLRITDTHSIQISLDTIARICDDILLLKANQIDHNTAKLMTQQKKCVMALDGQDPGSAKFSLWLFTDIISGRLLAVRHVSSINYIKLHNFIEEIKTLYDVEIIGFISDKQGLITKCMDTFYPDTPHQYCQFHFLNNHWRHLAAKDSGLYMALKSTINKLYIHTADKTQNIFFEGLGKQSVREIFTEIDKDLQKFLRKSGKRFEVLRGITIYSELVKYVAKGEKSYLSVNPETRFGKILRNTLDRLQAILNSEEGSYNDLLLGFDLFNSIKSTLSSKFLTKQERIETLEQLYERIWLLAQRNGIKVALEEIKSITVKKNRSFGEILAEWVRLWNSYKRGLFKYYEFPVAKRTNIDQERSFGWQKQQIYARTAKKMISHMVVTRGPYYLRLFHADEQEKHSDLLDFYDEAIIQGLRGELKHWISVSTEDWRNHEILAEGFDITCRSYYKPQKTPTKIT